MSEQTLGLLGMARYLAGAKGAKLLAWPCCSATCSEAGQGWRGKVLAPSCMSPTLEG